MPREVRYWNSKAFRQVYGSSRASKGFPRQDAEGYYLTMGYRLRLDDGQPEGGEPSPEPSAAVRGDPVAARRPAVPPAAAQDSENRQALYGRFTYSGGYDGYEGRMVQAPEPAAAPQPRPGRRDGRR